MTTNLVSPPSVALRQTLATVAFAAVVAGLIGMTLWFVEDDLLERSDAVTVLRDRLAQIDGRTRPDRLGAQDPRAMGSPFLEGPTITVAGAALQQRVDAAVTKAGGAVVSSQVDLDGPEANDGFVNLTENIEIAQLELQPLLYDIEAGMPYLFINTLGVQTPQGAEESESERLIVVMGVTGQWQRKR
jgi:general secretion pathway protein M